MLVVGAPSGARSNRKNSASQPAIIAKPSFRARVDLALERVPGTAVEGLLVRGVDVAEEPRHPAALVVVRQHAEGGEVGLEQHVRLLDPHEPLDRRPVEHDLAVQRLLELAARHLDVLVDAQDVGELQPEEVDAEAAASSRMSSLRAPVRSVGKSSRLGRSAEPAGALLPGLRHEVLCVPCEEAMKRRLRRRVAGKAHPRRRPSPRPAYPVTLLPR